jgi:hypothetical protein
LKKSENNDWLCWLHFGLFISPLREIVKTRNAILFLIKSRNKKNKRVENLISKNKDREQQSTYFITTITLKQREWVLREGERYTVRERERERVWHGEEWNNKQRTKLFNPFSEAGIVLSALQMSFILHCQINNWFNWNVSRKNYQSIHLKIMSTSTPIRFHRFSLNISTKAFLNHSVLLFVKQISGFIDQQMSQ